MPNKKTEEINQNYAAKEFERIEVSEGPESVNSAEEQSESRAVANSGNRLSSMSGSSGRLGAGKSLGNTTANISDNSKSTENNSVSDKGSGNLNQKTAPKVNTPALSPGNISDNLQNTLSEEKIVEDTGDFKHLEKQLESVDSSPDDDDDLSKAKATLNQILKESADLPEDNVSSKKGASSISGNKGGGSLSGLKSSKSLSNSNNSSKSIGNSVDTNKNPELSQEEQNLQNEFAGSLGDAGKETVQTEDPDAAIINEGRQLGLESGRINGLGKYIYTDAGGKMQIKDFPFRDEQKQQTFESLEDYTSKIEAPLQQHPNPKFKTAYYKSYNEGFNEGEQLKTDIANREKQKEQSSPQFIEDKMKGLEAGTMSASQNPEDKTRAKQLTQSFENQLEGLDENQKIIRQKAFDLGYNKGLGDAETALIQTEKNRSRSPEYLEGFKAGKFMGSAVKNKTVISEEMKQKHDLLNKEMDENGKMTLRSKGYNQGYNKGYSDAEQLEIAANSGKTELLQKDEHFNAGMVKGTVSMMLQASGKSSGDLLFDLLDGSVDIKQVFRNSYTIPEDVIFYFKNRKHEGQNEKQKKLFKIGFVRGYNSIHALLDNRLKSNRQRGSENSNERSAGVEIGKLGGEASELNDRLKQKLAGLKTLRVTMNPANVVPTAQEQTLMTQIKKIEACLKTIQDIVDTKDSVYQKDYYTSYNEAFSTAQIRRIDDVKLKRENETTGSDETAKTDFQKGLGAGRGFGIAVYNSRKKPVAAPDLQDKIEAAFQKSKDKGIHFNNGFVQGYNEKVEIGSGETKTENVSETQKAGLDVLEAKKSNKKEGKIYFEKGREEGFEQWYNFSKKLEDERAESPENKWIKRKENNNAEIIEDIKDDFEEMKKEPLLSYQQLAQDFINGYEAGKYKGKIFGENFLEGYRAGLNGLKPNPVGKARYSEGFEEGKKKAQYSSFRDNALTAWSNSGSKLEIPKKIQKAESTNIYYQKGYLKHINPWIKVFTIDAGLQVAQSLNTVSIDDLTALEESKHNENAQVNLNTRQKVQYIVKNESALIQKIIKKSEPEIKENIKKEMSDKYKVAVEDIPESNIATEIISAVDDFKNGYESAVQFAKEKTEQEKSENQSYHKGLLMGYKQGGAHLPQNLSDSVKRQFLSIPETENPEDLQSRKYSEGKMKGFQLSVQVKNALIEPKEIITEMAGPEYFSGYQKGTKKGIQDAENFRLNILRGEKTKTPKLEDLKERENLNGEMLNGFDYGYQQAFKKTKEEIKTSRIL